MTGREIFDAGCTGAMIAVVLRWLLRLDVDLHWAVCIGAVSLLLQPWLTLHFGPAESTQTPANLILGAAVAIALLGVAQAAGDRA